MPRLPGAVGVGATFTAACTPAQVSENDEFQRHGRHRFHLTSSPLPAAVCGHLSLLQSGQCTKAAYVAEDKVTGSSSITACYPTLQTCDQCNLYADVDPLLSCLCDVNEGTCEVSETACDANEGL
ncbi:PREDICTED: protein FAM24A isoform X1 [Condylura cristata]|uniref:protein FAM24A isoform X1 n=1 Tax=Condylura cristata TaxID=143302 RepID=UPI0006434E0B|nr:PREDICTED: protein FAM24A isoform X1 [Condylura cristata]